MLNKPLLSLVLPLLLISLLPMPSTARWATAQDAAISVDFYNRDVQIASDGTAKETIEMQVTILKEQGRNIWATHPIIYNADSTSIKILAAKTNYLGQLYPVPLKQIEDKPLASNTEGFDQKHQILIAFPHAEVGAKLYLKYEEKLFHPPMKDFFSTEFVFGATGFWQASHVHINSKLPLYMEVNDPDKVLAITKHSKQKGTTVDIVLKKPVFKQIIDEPTHLLNPKNLPWVSVSSQTDWTAFSKQLSKDYQTVLAQPLPKTYLPLVEKARQEKSLVDKINVITASLADKLQYMGDWRTQKGRYIPRSLATIANAQLADCKDFSVMTAAILNRLGIKAYPALIARGHGIYYPPNQSLPTINFFNHAIVKVVDDGKTYWLDPTNHTAMADKIYPDIADRWALVLSREGSSLEKTASVDLTQMQTINTEELDLILPGYTFGKGQTEFKGQYALQYTAASKFASSETIKQHFTRSLVEPHKIITTQVKLPELTSRIVSDLTFNYNYTQKSDEFQTNAGLGLPIASASSLSDFKVVPEQVSDVYIGPPRTLKSSKKYLHINPQGHRPIHCDIKSPWIDAKRDITVDKESVSVNELIQIKQSWIDNKELKKQQYKQLQSQLEQCFMNTVAIIFIREGINDLFRPFKLEYYQPKKNNEPAKNQSLLSRI